MNKQITYKIDTVCMLWENQGDSLDSVALRVITRTQVLSAHKMFEEDGEGSALLVCRMDHSP